MVEYYRNHPMGNGNNYFSKAVIVIHGTNRNADEYYDTVNDARTDIGDSRTLVFAPKFQTYADNPGSDELYWSSGGWKKGYKSQDGSSTSSFVVIDDILEAISSRFPSVKQITIVGHSAGGQFVQRYAGVGLGPNFIRTDIDVRYIVSNPSSYMFLTSSRPNNWSPTTTGCDEYDEYKYGLDDMPGHLSYANVNNINKSEIKDNLILREVYLLLGMEDNDPNSNYLDTSCEANAQGGHRLARGMNYFDHVKDYDSNANTHEHTVPGVGHSSSGMFSSDEGIDLIFWFK